FADQVQRVAAGLSELGIGKGDKVVIHLRNCPEFLVSWFALARLGAVMVPSNVANTVSELDFVVENSEAIAAVTQSDYLELLQKVAQSQPRMNTIIVTSGAKPHTQSGVLEFATLL